MTLGNKQCRHSSGAGRTSDSSFVISRLGSEGRCPTCLGSGRGGGFGNHRRRHFLLRLCINLLIADGGVLGMLAGYPAVGIAAVGLMPLVGLAFVRRY